MIAHPITGRAALYANSDFTTHFEGWSVEESRPLLDQIDDARIYVPGHLGAWNADDVGQSRRDAQSDQRLSWTSPADAPDHD